MVLHLLLNEVQVPGSNAVVVDGEAFAGRGVEEGHLVGDVHANWVSNEGLSTLDIPDNERVVILTAQRGEILLVETEGKRLDKHLVELESVNHLQGVEVPDDDIGLESHVSLLTGGNIFASVADLDYGDVVVVTPQELLST